MEVTRFKIIDNLQWQIIQKGTINTTTPPTRITTEILIATGTSTLTPSTIRALPKTLPTTKTNPSKELIEAPKGRRTTSKESTMMTITTLQRIERITGLKRRITILPPINQLNFRAGIGTDLGARDHTKAPAATETEEDHQDRGAIQDKGDLLDHQIDQAPIVGLEIEGIQVEVVAVVKITKRLMNLKLEVDMIPNGKENRV